MTIRLQPLILRTQRKAEFLRCVRSMRGLIEMQTECSFQLRRADIRFVDVSRSGLNQDTPRCRLYWHDPQSASQNPGVSCCWIIQKKKRGRKKKNRKRSPGVWLPFNLVSQTLVEQTLHSFFFPPWSSSPEEIWQMLNPTVFSLREDMFVKRSRRYDD